MRPITTIEYGSKEYLKSLLYTDYHEYVDSCGVGWLVADNYQYKCLMPENY